MQHAALVQRPLVQPACKLPHNSWMLCCGLQGHAEVDQLPTESIKRIKECYKQMRAVYSAAGAELQQQLHTAETNMQRNGAQSGLVGHSVRQCWQAVGQWAAHECGALSVSVEEGRWGQRVLLLSGNSWFRWPGRLVLAFSSCCVNLRNACTKRPRAL